MLLTRLGDVHIYQIIWKYLHFFVNFSSVNFIGDYIFYLRVLNINLEILLPKSWTKTQKIFYAVQTYNSGTRWMLTQNAGIDVKILSKNTRIYIWTWNSMTFFRKFLLHQWNFYKEKKRNISNWSGYLAIKSF